MNVSVRVYSLYMSVVELILLSLPDVWRQEE